MSRSTLLGTDGFTWCCGELLIIAITCPVDIDRLLSEWKELLILRDPGFMWDGASYEKSRRSQAAANVAGLVLHYPALLPLIKMAPSGFPSHKDLRSVFEKAQGQHNIFNIGGKMCLNWRTMRVTCGV